MDVDLREELRARLLDDWGIELQPRGSSLDVAEIHTTHGFCATPVVVQLPDRWVSEFAEAESLGYLATLIAEAVDTDSTTQLVELRVSGDWLRRPVLKVVRR